MILDTCAISEMLDSQRDPTFAGWLAAIMPSDLRITTISIAEARYGVGRLPNGKRKDALCGGLEGLFAKIAILDFCPKAARIAGAILSGQEQQGMRMHFADAAIAAIAHHHNRALVTRDNDFEGISALPGFESFSILRPWKA